jgi:hypothetical protein
VWNCHEWLSFVVDSYRRWYNCCDSTRVPQFKDYGFFIFYDQHVSFIAANAAKVPSSVMANGISWMV